MPALNPILFERLGQLYGRVLVGRQGEAAVVGYRPSTMTGKPKPVYEYGGEAYRVNCPFCVQVNASNPDTKHRLWIGHTWGAEDQYVPGKHWGEAVCYHNNCLENWENNRYLQNVVYGDMLFSTRQRVAIEQGVVVERPTELDFPQFCVPLHELAPDHPANLYLYKRKFDPRQISLQYGVRYCYQPPPDYPMITGRLIIPIVMDGKMVMWQARYLGDLPKGSKLPKYLNPRGVSKSALLYGFDEARKSPFVTITEGITNVWRLGSGAVAILGKSVSYPQYMLLKTHWPGGALIALDSGTYLESEATYSKLSKDIPTVKLLLPDGHDPDTLGVDAFWRLAVEAMTSQGVRLG